jgi:hypothetical protein
MSGQIPYPFLQNPNCLFDNPEFFAHHATNFPGSVFLHSQGKEKWGCSFLLINHRYINPGRGSFGILSDCPNEFSKLSSFPIETTTPPLILLGEKANDYLDYLHFAGFQFLESEPSYLIKVNSQSAVSLFDRGNRKRFQKAQRLGFEFFRTFQWHSLYDLLQENRKQKGAMLALSKEEIQFMMNTFPTRCQWYAVKQNSRTIAAAFVLQTLDAVWQVVYWGHLPGTEEWSPVTYLAAALYEEAQNEGIKFLDLGTASLEGKPNEGLIRFKRNLGAEPSLKMQLIRLPQAT